MRSMKFSKFLLFTGAFVYVESVIPKEEICGIFTKLVFIHLSVMPFYWYLIELNLVLSRCRSTVIMWCRIDSYCLSVVLSSSYTPFSRPVKVCQIRSISDSLFRFYHPSDRFIHKKTIPYCRDTEVTSQVVAGEVNTRSATQYPNNTTTTRKASTKTLYSFYIVTKIIRYILLANKTVLPNPETTMYIATISITVIDFL